MASGLPPRLRRCFSASPLLALEHCALATLLLLIALRPAPPCDPRPPAPSAAPTHLSASIDLDAISRIAGSQSVFDDPNVARAPIGAIEDSLLSPGDVGAIHDARGDIFRLSVGRVAGEDVFVNAYRTVAGSLRSGDLHNCTQFDVLVAGRAALRSKDLAGGREEVRDYVPGTLIAIPPRTPHIFEFGEDGALVEWWDCGFEAWHYRPYREVIEMRGEG